MKCRYLALSAIVASAALLCSSALGITITPVLGDAQPFAVLAGSTVTNAGGVGTTITGNLGVWSSGGANAITSFDLLNNTIVGNGTTGSVTNGGGIVNPGTIYAGGAIPQAAQTSLTAAIVALNGLPVTQDLTGQVLGDGVGGTKPSLGPGVYSFPTTAELSGKLTLNAGGINGVYWVFQIGTALTTDSSSSVVLDDVGTNNGSDVGVFWVVGSAANLGFATAFQGNILADTEAITLVSTASIINGRALARTAAVNLDNNVISNICLGNLDSEGHPGPGFSGGLGFNEQGELVAIPTTNGGPSGTIPEPCTFVLIGSGLVSLLASRKRLWGCRCRSKA